MHWIIQSGTSVLMGPEIGGEIADYVMTGWAWDDPPPQWWA